MERTERSIEINAPVEVVFDLFSDFEKFPEWMRHIKEVRRTGENYTRWKADAPLGLSVEWEAETTELEPNSKIAWRTVRGDVEMEGEVTFEETKKGTTQMHVSLGYSPPAGHLGTLIAKLFGNDPEKEIDEELSRFVTLAQSRAVKRGRSRKKGSSNKSRRSAKRATA
jgi:uncharacterized membrane protein